ncbi:MAG: FeoB-associated Cys-rich membrane protein [Pseudomonadota bacterium]
MIENLIVALIVGAAAWYAFGKYLKPKAKSGCGSGCGSCNACETPAQPSSKRVIRIHAQN